MKTERILLVLGLLVILGYLLGIWRDNQNIRRVNDEYIREVENYKNAVEEYRKRAQQQFDDNLTAAGTTHELFIYEDTSHYLDQINITPDTAELYRRLAIFLDTYVRQGGHP